MLVFLSFTLSVLFVCMGVIGEYLIVLLQEIKRRPAAIVASAIGDVSLQRPAYELLDATTHTMAKGVSVI